MMYLVIDEYNNGEAFVMWEGTDLEEAKKEARDFDDINKRDGNKCTTILVDAAEWEDGNYDPIDFHDEWYAVMCDAQNDDWGTGSYSLAEAFDILESNDEYKLIAVIKNDVCIDEIYKENL